MECERCGDRIEHGEEREWYGKVLCEDCYMDVLSPARTCDPWAVHSAKSFMKGGVAETLLNPLQRRILEILEETGGTELKDLAEKLQTKPSDLEREIAALRHMEKIRGELREGKKFLILW